MDESIFAAAVHKNVQMHADTFVLHSGGGKRACSPMFYYIPGAIYSYVLTKEVVRFHCT